MNNNIKLSVIVPVYNTELFIVKCISSILEYKGGDIEVIIVDDGSPDGAISMVRENFSDVRLKILRQENSGLSSARNSGIKIAQGEYIMHLDSDDYLSSGCISKILSEIDKANGFDVLIFDINIVSADGCVSSVWHDGALEEDRIYSGISYLEQYFMGLGSPAIWNKVWRRTLYLNNSISHPQFLSYGEDGSTTPRLLFFATKIKKLNIPMINYVQHGASMMSNKRNIDIKISSYKKAFAIVDSFFIAEADCDWYFRFKSSFKINYLYEVVFYKYYLSREICRSKESRDFYMQFLRDVKELNYLYSWSTINAIKRSLIVFCYKLFGIFGDVSKFVIDVIIGFIFRRVKKIL